jgi:hypothetical protein
VSYDVTWQPAALSVLAALWNAAADKAAVTAAADEIDRQLARAAATCGESREEDIRVH